MCTAELPPTAPVPVCETADAVCCAWGQLRSAQQLKDEGNRLFAAKAHEQAADKYTRAKASLTGAAQA